MIKRYSLVLTILAVGLVIVSLFLPYYSGFTNEQVNSTSIPVEDIGYDTTFSGFQSLFSYFNCGVVALVLLIRLFGRYGKIPLIILTVIYGLGLLLLFIGNELTLGARPYGDTMLYGFLLMTIATFFIVVQTYLHVFTQKPVQSDQDLLD